MLTALCSELTGACVPPCVPLVTKSLAWPGGWRTLATSCARLDRAAQPSVSLTSLILGPAHRPAESPEPELCPGSSPPPPSLSIPDTKPLWSPGPLTRPRQAVQAHLVYLHLNHQYTDLHLNAFSQRPVASRFSLIWESILVAALTILTGVGHCNTHHSDTPGWGSIQMVEDENKKSFNDCFDLQKNWKDESSVVKLH